MLEQFEAMRVTQDARQLGKLLENLILCGSH